MAETFLLLLAGGIMLAVAISDPRQVTLLWLRLAGILSLSMIGLSAFFALRTEHDGPTDIAMFICAAGCVLGQLAFTQTARRTAQRWCAVLATGVSIGLASRFFPTDGAWTKLPSAWRIAVPLITSAGVAAVSGLSLMDMLLGHAYLTAANMTMRPFRRLNLALAVAMVLRGLSASVLVFLLLRVRTPVEMLWGIYGLYAATRWFVGLLVPAVFIYMADDCIRRRATQSATGILYVAGVLLFIGELVALYLARQTALPF